MAGVSEDVGSARQRTGRRAGRQRAGIAAPAFLTRVIPPYEILSEDGLARIEAATDRILAEVGIDIRGDEESIRLFRESGASVGGERVRFEPGHLREILKTAPAEFTQVARNPARSVQIGGRATVMAPAW